MKDIKIKYFDTDDYEIPRLQATEKGDWIDIRASKDIFVPSVLIPENGEKQTGIQTRAVTFIPLGVAMQLPDGYEAHLAPRSSTFKTWGIIQVNSVGVIDNSYSGDNDMWMMPAVCISPKDYYNDADKTRGTWIHRGDRICQFRIMEKMPELTFTEVKHLADKDRGGFGSTGRS